MANQNTTIAKNTLFLSLRMVFVLFVSLYTSRVFLNVLGVEDYGISNVVAGFVSMFSFLNTSLANAIQRFYNAELGKNGSKGITKVYNTSLLIQGIIALFVVALLESVGLWYLYEKMVIPSDRFDVAFWLYQFSTISAAVVIMQSPFTAAVMAYERMNTYAVISILEVILKLGFALALPYISIDRLLMYGAFYMVLSILTFLSYFIYSKKEFKELHFQRSYKKSMFKDMISFSGWNLCGTFACMIREQGLNMVLNIFFGPIVNAARGVAYQVSGALQGFVSNLSLAAKPQMVQSFATGDSSRTIKLMYTMSKLSFIFLFVLSVPVIFNIDYILHLWLGNVVPDHAANFVILVIITNFMNNLNAPLSNVVYATGKMRNYEVTFSVINLLIIPISFIVLKLGAPAEMAFIVYLVMTVFVQIGCLLVIQTLTKISLSDYFMSFIVPIVIVACITLPLIYIINFYLQQNLIGIVIEYIVITLLSSVLFYYVVLDSTEKKFVNNIIYKLKKR